MSTRVICPACGKLNRLPDDVTPDTTMVCLACGVRIPPQEVEAQLPTDAGESPSAAARADGDADTTEIPATPPPPAPTSRPRPAPAGQAGGAASPRAARPPRSGRRTALVAAACLLLGAAGGSLAMWALRPSTGSDTRDLLALKSE